MARASGVPPRGFRAPYWSLSEGTLDLVAELGIVYDSSLMADDVRLHRVRRGDVHDARAGSRLGPPGPLVEVPVSWALDDWPHFEPGARGVGPMSAPSKVEEIWTGELRYAWEREPGGLLTITMHPEAIGRGHRLLMLERFIARGAGARRGRLRPARPSRRSLARGQPAAGLTGADRGRSARTAPPGDRHARREPCGRRRAGPAASDRPRGGPRSSSAGIGRAR